MFWYYFQFISFVSIHFSPLECFDDDDDDDDVRQVWRTPGVPCGCTWQHSQRNGLPLPSNWIKYWSVFSSWLCCSLIISTFSCLSLTDLSNLPRVQLHFWCRHPPHSGLPFLPCSCCYSQHYIFLQGLMCTHHMPLNK